MLLADITEVVRLLPSYRSPLNHLSNFPDFHPSSNPYQGMIKNSPFHYFHQIDWTFMIFALTFRFFVFLLLYPIIEQKKFIPISGFLSALLG
jgi:hypothetical protein